MLSTDSFENFRRSEYLPGDTEYEPRGDVLVWMQSEAANHASRHTRKADHMMQ